MNEEITKEAKRLMAFSEIIKAFWFDELAEAFESGDEDGLYHFKDLKPLFDEFGYETTIEVLKEIHRLKKEGKKDE